jgi:hypothetical protein
MLKYRSAFRTPALPMLEPAHSTDRASSTPPPSPKRRHEWGSEAGRDFIQQIGSRLQWGQGMGNFQKKNYLSDRRLTNLRRSFAEKYLWENWAVAARQSSGSNVSFSTRITTVQTSTAQSSHIYIYIRIHICTRSRGSSVSVESDYGLDGRGSIPDRGRGFFL